MPNSDALGTQRKPDGWALLAPVVGFVRLGQHGCAVVQERYRFQAVLFGAVVGDLAVKYLVSVEFGEAARLLLSLLPRRDERPVVIQQGS